MHGPPPRSQAARGERGDASLKVARASSIAGAGGRHTRGRRGGGDWEGGSCTGGRGRGRTDSVGASCSARRRRPLRAGSRRRRARPPPLFPLGAIALCLHTHTRARSKLRPPPPRCHSSSAMKAASPRPCRTSTGSAPVASITVLSWRGLGPASTTKSRPCEVGWEGGWVGQQHWGVRLVAGQHQPARPPSPPPLPTHPRPVHIHQHRRLRRCAVLAVRGLGAGAQQRRVQRRQDCLVVV